MDGGGRVNRLRTMVYQAVFLVGSALIVVPVPLVGLRGQAAMVRYAHGWSRFARWCARRLLGITARVEGGPIAGPALYACKHQSLLETTELEIVLDGAAPVIKRELWNLPLWGWAVQVYGAIPVDREASAGALRSMLRDAKALKVQARSVVIYPEGTRVMPGEQPPLRAGFAGLYRALGYPVVPIAVDTGRLLPKRGAKRAGVATIRFGDPIPPGLGREEIEARVHAGINALEG